MAAHQELTLAPIDALLQAHNDARQQLRQLTTHDLLT